MSLEPGFVIRKNELQGQVNLSTHTHHQTQRLHAALKTEQADVICYCKFVYTQPDLADAVYRRLMRAALNAARGCQIAMCVVATNVVSLSQLGDKPDQQVFYSQDAPLKEIFAGI